MERRKKVFFVTLLVLMISILYSNFNVKIKNNVNIPKLDSNLDLEINAINNINQEFKYKYLKNTMELPTKKLEKEDKTKQTVPKKKIITEKKQTKKDLYGTVKKTITTTKYEVNGKNKKQISKKKSTKYEISDQLLKKANKWYDEESSYMKESLKYINGYRKEANKKSVKLDKKLCIAAYIRAYEIAESNNFSHTRPGNRKCFTVLNDLKINYYFAGENLAMGSYDSPENVVNAWAYSKKHYENMIISSHRKVGLAYIKVGDTYYWAQIFTN